MSQRIGLASSDRIFCGSSPSHSNLAAGTIAVVVDIINTNPGYSPRLYNKGVFANGTLKEFQIVGSTSTLEGFIQRAGTALNITASLTAFPAWLTAPWLLLAFTWDINASASDQKMYMGSERFPVPTEPSSYTAQSLGSGGLADDSAENMQLFNRLGTNAAAFVGYAAFGAIWSRQLAPCDLADWFSNPRRVGPNNVLLHYYGRNGSDLQFDRSGYGNHGALTGTVVSLHDPIRHPDRLRRPRLGAMPFEAAGGPDPFLPMFGQHRRRHTSHILRR